MASASRSFARAIRPTPAFRALGTSTTHKAIARSFQQQARRGYSSSGSQSANSPSYIWSSAAASVALAAAGYYTIVQKHHPLAEEPTKPFTPTTADYQEVYDAIAAKLIDESDYDDGSYGPVVLRLGWHASGTYDAQTKTGGSNGATMRFAPEKEHGANSGLHIAQTFLEPVHTRFPWITYSDLWTLAAACAIQEMGGPDIPWRPGRADRDASFCTPDGRLPDGSKGQNHLRAIFGRMGFNDQEIVALSGAHALGRCHTDRSGFSGPWTFSPITLTNDYYKLLFDEKWQWKTWGGPKQYEDRGTRSLMMLPTDMAIIEDERMSRYAKQYAEDQDKFFRDFSDVVVKLFELGVPFKTDEGARIRFRRTE